jgi:hypothetical protein
MKFLSSFLALAIFLASFSGVLAQYNWTDTDGLVFSATVSGNVTQTFVLMTTTTVLCPCSTTVQVAPAITSLPASTSSSATATQSLAIVTGTSSGSSLRPGLLAVGGALGVVSSLFFILA